MSGDPQRPTDAGCVENWQTGRDIPSVEDRHRTAAAWALDRNPDCLTWEGLTASHVSPERVWQARRVAEAFARFERFLSASDGDAAELEGGK